MYVLVYDVRHLLLTQNTQSTYTVCDTMLYASYLNVLYEPSHRVYCVIGACFERGEIYSVTIQIYLSIWERERESSIVNLLIKFRERFVALNTSNRQCLEFKLKSVESFIIFVVW